MVGSDWDSSGLGWVVEVEVVVVVVEVVDVVGGW